METCVSMVTHKRPFWPIAKPLVAVLLLVQLAACHKPPSVAVTTVEAKAPLMVWPQSLKTGETLPVAVWLHGYGADPTKIVTEPMYQEVADRLHLAIAGVYATHPLAEDSYEWSEQPALDYEQVRQSLALAEADKGVHFSPKMVFGFSQGACVAAELAARHPAEFRGAIVLSPGANTRPAPLPVSPGQNGQIYYLSCGAGEAEGNVQFTERYARFLTQTGATVHSRLVPHMAKHGRPPDWPERFPEWVAAILAGKP